MKKMNWRREQRQNNTKDVGKAITEMAGLCDYIYGLAFVYLRLTHVQQVQLKEEKNKFISVVQINWLSTGYLRGEHLWTRKLSLSNKNRCK